MFLVILTVLGLHVLPTKCDVMPLYESNYAAGRDVMVHLMEWRWEDIANECENYLAPMKFAGVSPPNENAVIDYMDWVIRPWWERYQPVSYNLITRSGNEEEFTDMVRRCNNVGVRIYVDAVINHMTGPLPNGTIGTGGSQFDSQQYLYPSVPYDAEDFNSPSECSGDDVKQIRDCELVSLKDLNLHRDDVRDKIKSFFNHLLSIGVAGFRIDAAKHMWPEDLQEIYKDLKLSSEFFSADSRPLIFQEVISYSNDDAIDRNEYINLARVTEFRYGQKLSNVFRGNDQLRWLKNFGQEWDMAQSNQVLVFIDNHDNQRSNDGNVLNFFEPELYQKALTFMISWPYGLKRIISSYRWTRIYEDGKDLNSWVGPPHDHEYNTLPVKFRSDGSCRNGWVCEHRWPNVARMVQWSTVAADEPVVNWWDNEANQIAFSRGNKAFYAVNNDVIDMSVEVETKMPPGRYCDVITGEVVNGSCTGRIVSVDYNGKISLFLPTDGAESILAIHIQSMIEEFGLNYPVEIANLMKTKTEFKNTAVLIYKFGRKPLFMKGGVNMDMHNCLDDPGLCSIPIVTSYDDSNVEVNILNWENASNVELHWTTNDKSDESYNNLNVYGSNYWLLNVKMDCSKTYYGWFDFRVISEDGHEEPEVINKSCSGDYKIEIPYESTNHVAMCGKINVYKYGTGSCVIRNFKNYIESD
ncbi:Alphaamylase [Chamberlinius hualienensis]